MPRIPIFRLGGAPDKPALPNLAASTPFVSLEGISVGVDNLRHDVLLSPRFAELARAPSDFRQRVMSRELRTRDAQDPAQIRSRARPVGTQTFIPPRRDS